jgi:hypothetical protein
VQWSDNDGLLIMLTGLAYIEDSAKVGINASWYTTVTRVGHVQESSQVGWVLL